MNEDNHSVDIYGKLLLYNLIKLVINSILEHAKELINECKKSKKLF